MGANSGALEDEIRNTAEKNNIDYEDFFLHFSILLTRAGCFWVKASTERSYDQILAIPQTKNMRAGRCIGSRLGICDVFVYFERESESTLRCTIRRSSITTFEFTPRFAWAGEFILNINIDE
ncbi:hypothetical protein O9993_17715 [Vibrio lentus]|nr:hypothetical protein [Vibrio lentus]